MGSSTLSTRKYRESLSLWLSDTANYTLYTFSGFNHSCKKIVFAFVICSNPTPAKIKKIVSFFIDNFTLAFKRLIIRYGEATIDSGVREYLSECEL